MFVACGIWCLADVSSVSPSSEQTGELPSLLRRRANTRNVSLTPYPTGDKHTISTLLIRPIFKLDIVCPNIARSLVERLSHDEEDQESEEEDDDDEIDGDVVLEEIGDDSESEEEYVMMMMVMTMITMTMMIVITMVTVTVMMKVNRKMKMIVRMVVQTLVLLKLILGIYCVPLNLAEPAELGRGNPSSTDINA